MYVGDLEDSELDYWVARAQGHDRDAAKIFVRSGNFHPSVDWEQGGPIFEKAGITVSPSKTGIEGWFAVRESEGYKTQHFGRTVLVAAMRCFVAHKLGNSVVDSGNA